ncbi:hypothetical protein A2382_05165 [Candidatus Woesebacteria bacterium RIFOXYB1_FULL_38_16]|uniref:Large ribosomal subunit protein uL22 n=1 Tax=Candidatus Woesebacteria bacterium RIFOXYB1_FULL_38_16 TaxID=1802538 RepID=A0A1F8CUN7_9BACT|nr:MAG: hypothetical protein A2382_05165 [Candidatus Woesebacteria bacterium RIFOXYB1_FULL_38_16]
MEAISTQTHIKTSPRKLRLVVQAVKKMTPESALEVLPRLFKRAADPLQKVIRSAVANAVSKGMDPANLKFKEIQVNEGPRTKRGLPVSRGMWHSRIKRMSHVRVVLEEKSEELKKIKGKAKETDKDEKKEKGKTTK